MLKRIKKFLKAHRFLRIVSGILAGFLVFFVAVCIRSAWEVKHPELVRQKISSPALPESFDGYRILQLSDLHSYFGRARNLLEEIRQDPPDLIAVTGDVVSRGASEDSLENLAVFVRELCEIAPVYYVGGNHEAQQEGLWERVVTIVSENGGTVLSDKSVLLEREGEAISLWGLRDPARRQSPLVVQKSLKRQTKDALASLNENAQEFVLLLAHRPEDARMYASAGVDVALSGHTHGGQIRLPFIGAVFAPMQGFFPQYSAGLYEVDEMQLYVSRGMGGEIRFLCRPEITLIELTND